MESVKASVLRCDEKVVHLTSVINLLQQASDDQDAEIRKLNKLLGSKASAFPHLNSG